MVTPGVGETRGIMAVGMILGTVTRGTMEDGTAVGTVAGATRGTTAVGDIAVLITTTTTISSVLEAAGSTRPVFPRQAQPTEAESVPHQGALG